MDPLPEVRATAARAVGSLVKGMGPAYFADVLPWLRDKMRSEASAVERSGAAQGLAEVLAVQGGAAVGALLPEVLAGCRERNAAAREGSLTLFKYLPRCMPDEFRQYLGEVRGAGSTSGGVLQEGGAAGAAGRGRAGGGEGGDGDGGGGMAWHET